jgi:hypothetical protein
LIKKFSKKYIGKSTIDHKKYAIENIQFKYNGMYHIIQPKIVFKSTKALNSSAFTNCFTMHEKIRKITPQNLMPSARLKCLDNGGDQLQEKEEIMNSAVEF